MEAASVLTAIGLGLDMVGALALFAFAPEKSAHPQYGVSFEVEKTEVEQWKEDQKRRRIAVHSGAALLIVGFGLQILAVVCV